MKRFLTLVAAVLFSAFVVSGQDAATEERLNRLDGQIEGLITAHKALQKQISELADRIESLRESVNRPNGAYVTPEDLKPLQEAIQEVDRKRIHDAENIAAKLKEIQKLAAAAPPPRQERQAPPVRAERGFEYVVQSGDTLSTIIEAYREQGVKVTLDQVLKANPGLKPKEMQVGQKVFIPKP